MSATVDDIRELLEREPFRPFRLVMTSGKSYLIASPNLAMLLKSEVFVAFPDGEHWAHVPYLHISSIETAPNGRGHSNGRTKRKGR